MLQPLGSVTLHREVKRIRKKITFQVVDSNSPSFLSGQVSSALKLIVFNTECVRQLSEVKEGTDMWKAILEWLNVTTPGMHSSPAQRFFSRRTRSMLPCKTSDYTPQVQAEVQSTLIRKRQTAKTYYDRHTKSLPDLTSSYGVKVNGRFYRRNRIHIRQLTTLPTSVPAVPKRASMPQPAETKNLQAKPRSQRLSTHEKQLRRSSRVVKLPTQLRDYTL